MDYEFVSLIESLDKLLDYHLQIKSQVSIEKLEKEISDYINESSNEFRANFVELDRGQEKVWVLKYFSPAYLQSFLNNGKNLYISRYSGFTWGDGVYLTSIENPCSSMMYGSIGVVGWIDTNDIRRVYDACSPKGIELYQRWIVYIKGLYNCLTTTVHADWANRLLRNMFQEKFDIDIIVFHPDQSNAKYCDKKQDFWFLLSEQKRGGPAYSTKIKECKPLIIVGEYFEKSKSSRFFNDVIGKNFVNYSCRLQDPPKSKGRLNSLANDLKKLHFQNNEIIIVRP
jgi:hypothetical protein